jgi:hypothetical protein
LRLFTAPIFRQLLCCAALIIQAAAQKDFRHQECQNVLLTPGRGALATAADDCFCNCAIVTLRLQRIHTSRPTCWNAMSLSAGSGR